jgi:uncharacterized protein (DUF433 family)
MNYTEYIEIDPEKRFGKPIIIGTRISVYDVLSWLAEGMSVSDIISDFPELNETQIKACLSYSTESASPL